MTTSAQTSAHGLVRTVPTTALPAPSRPDLPSWFSGATTFLYAACGGLACVLTGLALLALITAVPVGLLNVGAELLSLFELATILCTGAWCHTIAHSRRIDPTTPALKPVWFLVSWFIPIVHIFVPHRMFGDLWASARWQQSDRRGSNTPLAPRPWIFTLWACTWGLLFASTVLAFFRDGGTTLFAVFLVLSAASMGLLGGVVRVIARELDGRHPPSPSTVTR